MTSKRLFTISVEDRFSSNEADLLSAAQEAAAEYAAAYSWTDVSVLKSNVSPKKSGDNVIHYFDIFGKGDAISFDGHDQPANEAPFSSDIAAAKDLNP